MRVRGDGRSCERRLRSVAVVCGLFREPMLTQQTAELVIAQAEQLRGDGLLELCALERTAQQLALVIGDGRAEVVGQRGLGGGDAWLRRNVRDKLAQRRPQTVRRRERIE